MIARSFRMKRIVALLLLLAACSRQEQRSEPAANEAAPAVNESPPMPIPPTEPGPTGPAVAESPNSPEAAAAVLRDYFRLIDQKEFVEAHRLWSSSSEDDDLSDGAFAGSFDRYRTYRAEIGTPGRVEGAAGSLYVDIPVTVTGELAEGGSFRLVGPVTLRWVNEVPGATAEQLQWRIVRSALKPRPD